MTRRKGFSWKSAATFGGCGGGGESEFTIDQRFESKPNRFNERQEAGFHGPWGTVLKVLSSRTRMEHVMEALPVETHSQADPPFGFREADRTTAEPALTLRTGQAWAGFLATKLR